MTEKRHAFTKEELNYLLDSLITRFLSSITQDQMREFKTKYPKFGWLSILMNKTKRRTERIKKTSNG